MPSIDENRRIWGSTYQWTDDGDEWSAGWGGVSAQWYGSILPRIHRFLPAAHILEIAPGYGRWTRFLLGHCERLTGIDLCERCVQHCAARLPDAKASFHVNDGRSLSAVADVSVDFAFSFDSLVHAEVDVINDYLRELARVLTPDGIAFLHHSNTGEYATYVRILGLLGRGGDRLARVGVIDPLQQTGRAATVSAPAVRVYAERVGLHCMSQELVNWGRTRRLIDCFTTLTPAGSRWNNRASQSVRNSDFRREASYWRTLSPLYAGPGAGDAATDRAARQQG
jgi:SAM-dependent methyltransferase